MEGLGVCVACGASGVEINQEQKCAHCASAQAPEAASAAQAPAQDNTPVAE